ncbi:hypothetical protein PsYK624_030770 [Phanerochaete sordida]|uniref:Uncharacterized protein n=1 Tax=Phanerochaete sordida TaxID=48140 RepID=A0A9P3L9X9_9APHY|nr:hypothetical protein PsYK624_030770 [Phanerochaete sordida]
MRLSAVGLTLLGLSAPLAASAAAHGEPGRRHSDIARRARSDVNVFEKRDFTNARFTFYDVGLGSCGKNNVASDFIVALNTPQYGDGYPGPNCFKTITITVGSKSTQATIMDECPGCPYAGLDMSRGLFDFFADESVGVLYGTWSFDDGAPAPPATTPPPPPPTTTPPPPPPKTTWTPPVVVSVWTPPPAPTTSSTPPPPPPPTTSSTWSSSSVWSSSSSSTWSPSPSPSSTEHSSTAEPSSSASSSAPAAPTTLDTLSAVGQAVVGLTGLLVAGAGAGAAQ